MKLLRKREQSLGLVFFFFFFFIFFLLFVNANVLIVTYLFANPTWNVNNFFFFLLLHVIYLTNFPLLDKVFFVFSY